ncbi:MAG: 3-hydroxybutyryl-CoA dehydrogenase [Mycobacterium sp.]|nr:3-hydroxybutyryl-CoA dehydrogenase [Mycobacterium sp.]
MSFNVPTDFASRHVAVIGAGTLGRRIALIFAAYGAEVRIYDLAEDQRRAAVDYVTQNLPALADEVTGVAPADVSPQADLVEAVHNAWLVVEAIPERLELKKQVFGQLDELASADAILASNSSSYASGLFLDKVVHPERVLNIHFYMPPKQNAVDVMSCGKTDRNVIDFVMATLPRFGLYPFEARRESTGFIFNRIWAAVKRESLEVVAESVSTPQEVDRMFQINTGRGRTLSDDGSGRPGRRVGYRRALLRRTSGVSRRAAPPVAYLPGARPAGGQVRCRLLRRLPR